MQNEGPGLQHLALKTDDIFATLRAMRAASDSGGFEFMPRASDEYYRKLPAKIGDVLSPEQYAECEELGILVDRDDQGVLLQVGRGRGGGGGGRGGGAGRGGACCLLLLLSCAV